MVAPDIDFLAGFDSFTKSIGNLGATAPLALGVFFYMQQDKKFEAAQKATSDLLLKDIKTTSELLLKDIKTTSELLSKDIKSNNNAEMKATSDLLAKDIKSTSENIDKLSKVIMDFTKKSS